MAGRHEHGSSRPPQPGAITAGEIERLIVTALPGARVQAQDMTGTGDHYEISVVSKKFTGKSLIEQHRLIFAILENEMDSRIHAVKLKTRSE